MRGIIKDKPGNSDKSERRDAHGERQHIRRGRKDISEKVQEGRGGGVMKSRVKLGDEFPGRGDSFQVGKGADSYPVPFEILFTPGTVMKVLPNYCFCFTVHLVFVEFSKQAAYSFALTHDNAFFNFSFTTIRALCKRDLVVPSGRSNIRAISS